MGIPISPNANHNDESLKNALEAEDDDAFLTTYCLDRERLHADLFWKRWLKEYMPIITRQSK